LQVIFTFVHFISRFFGHGLFNSPYPQFLALQLEFVKMKQKMGQNILEIHFQVLYASYKFDYIFFYNRTFLIPYLRQITFLYWILFFFDNSKFCTQFSRMDTVFKFLDTFPILLDTVFKFLVTFPIFFAKVW